MTLQETMTALEKAGTAQTRKIYARHGVTGAQFGVSFAALGALAKSIKRDHALAAALWQTGNHDARILATMIADPATMTDRDLEAWAKDLDNYCLTDAFAKVAMKTPRARAKAATWSAAPGEWVGRAGWHLHAFLAMSDHEMSDSDFEPLLATIEREIHTRKNRVRDAMNSALIAIGARSPELTKKALAAAKRIGVVEVDHGETGCKTPDAASYIAKMLARKTASPAKRAAAKAETKSAVRGPTRDARDRATGAAARREGAAGRKRTGRA